MQGTIPAFDERDQGLDDLATHARVAARQAGDLHHQREAHDVVAQQLAGADRMRQDQVALQLLQLGVGNALLREQAEAGVDAVGRIAFCDDALDRLRRGVDHGPRVGRQLDAQRRLPDAPQVRQLQPAGSDCQVSRRCSGHRSPGIIGSFRPLRRAQAIALS